MQRFVDWLKGTTQYWRNRAEIAEGKLTDADAKIAEAEAQLADAQDAIAHQKGRVTRWYKEWLGMLGEVVQAKETNVRMQEELDSLRVAVRESLTQGE